MNHLFILCLLVLFSCLGFASALGKADCKVSARIEEVKLQKGGQEVHSGELKLTVFKSSCDFLKASKTVVAQVNRRPWDFEVGQELTSELTQGSSMGPSGAVSWIVWKVIEFKDKNQKNISVNSLNFVTGL